MPTKFATVYNYFLGKITDDMYLELTPEDTVKDLQKMLLASIPDFEFPRKNLYDYTLQVDIVSEEEVSDSDFCIKESNETPKKFYIENSCFNIELTPEEINILAIIMMSNWLQRQVTSIENTRMKYSGADFKMTSQANHLAKLLALQTEVRRQSTHAQRLYGRRRVNEKGTYESNWKIFRGE